MTGVSESFSSCRYTGTSVASTRLVVGFVLALPLTILSALALSEVLRRGLYMIIVAPAVCMLLAVAAVWMTVWIGRCRNRWVGALTGFVIAVVAVASSYQF